MSNTTVTTTIDPRGIATVMLDHAEKHNAFDDTIIAELRSAFDELALRDDVRVVVLASAGKNFSAGGDLAWMKRMAQYDYEHNLADARLLAGMLKALHDLPQPTIARVQGAAFGGAVGLISCCDMAVATEQSSFALSEVKIGLIPATISPFVISAIGQRASRRYFATAERFGAQEAHRLGLVNELVNEDELDEGVERLVASILQNGPLAVRASKALIVDIADREITAQLVEETCTRIANIRVSHEGQEGLTAFLDKRKPAWLTAHSE